MTPLLVSMSWDVHGSHVSPLALMPCEPFIASKIRLKSILAYSICV